MGAKIEIKVGDNKPVEVEAPEHNFSSGTHGFYFRDRILIGGISYHCQITISTK